MKQFLLFVVFFIGLSLVKCQLIHNEWSYNYSGTDGTDLQAGYYCFDRTNLYRQLGTTASPVSPLQTAGASFKTKGEGDLGFFFGLFSAVKDASLHFNYIIPQKINCANGVNCEMRGWNSSVNFGKDVFQKNKFIDVIFFHGIAFGNVRLNYENNVVNTHYSNPFFALNVMAEPKVNFFAGKKRIFSIGARAGYYLDLTHTKWKKKGDGLPDLPGNRLNAWYAQALLTLPF